MSNPDFGTSEFYAKKLKDSVSSFKREEAEKARRITEIQSAFENLSLKIREYYKDNELNTLIECKESTANIELKNERTYGNKEPFNCSIKIYTFERGHVSASFSPDSRKSSYGISLSKDHLIGFSVIAENNEYMTSEAITEYTPSPNEQYTLYLSKDGNWSVGILPIKIVDNKHIAQSQTIEDLTETIFLRMMESFFRPVIKF